MAAERKEFWGLDTVALDRSPSLDDEPNRLPSRPVCPRPVQRRLAIFSLIAGFAAGLVVLLNGEADMPRDRPREQAAPSPRIVNQTHHRHRLDSAHLAPGIRDRRRTVGRATSRRKAKTRAKERSIREPTSPQSPSGATDELTPTLGSGPPSSSAPTPAAVEFGL